jgi:hypothetical protein
MVTGYTGNDVTFFNPLTDKKFNLNYPSNNTSYSYSASTVNYYHVEPNSHFWTDLNMILNHEKFAPQYLTKKYLLIGLKNTLKHGYEIGQVKNLDMGQLTYTIFTSISDMIEYVNMRYFDMDEFCLMINTTINIGLNLTNGLKMERKEVYKRLDGERDYQDKKWVKRNEENGIPDNKKPIAEWLTYIEHHLNKAKNAVYYLNNDEALAEIRKVTALGVRAMEINGCPERKIPVSITINAMNDETKQKISVSTKDDKCCDDNCDCKK